MSKTMLNATQLSQKIMNWGQELGFQAVGISDIDLSTAEPRLLAWLDQGFQGEMEWMQRHGSKRSRPAELETGTVSIISIRLDYLPRTVPILKWY